MIEKIRKSLAIKISLLFLVAIIPPYFLTSLLYFQNSREAIYSEIVRGLKAETELIRENIDARLFLLRSNVMAWAGLEVMKDILTDDVDKRITSVLEGFKRDYRLTGEIYAIGKNGDVVASSNPLYIGRNIKDEYLVRGLSGEIIEIDAHSSKISSRQVISFIAPINPSFLGSKPIGAIVLEYEVNGLKDVLAIGGIPILAVLNKKGEVVVSSQEGAVEKTGITDYIDGKGTATAASSRGYIVALSVSKGYFDFKGFGWRLAGAVDEYEVLSPVRWVEKESLLLGISGAVVIFILIFVFANRAVRPLKELSIMADHIARTKDFTSGFVGTKRSDEVGKLAHAFNHMVEETKGYISKLKEMEEGVRRADRLSALGELSAGMAHEIKNPLGIIKSSADMLRTWLEKDLRCSPLASVISEESDRLAKILEAFLQFARPRPPQIAPCQINDVVKKSVSLLSPDIKKSGIIMEVELDDAVPIIKADADQLHQVFVNLIINAIQAMPEGGRLLVSSMFNPIFNTGQDAKSKTYDFVEIAFSDTGSGISQEYKDKIFNPFFTTKEKGSGLGLAIVQRIIEGHKGWIRVWQGTPSGITFRIYLPAPAAAYSNHGEEGIK
ncbi:MAG: HAMP domain-containing protein [Deltaproteobacteria bacterium]|nr:HAMP domain-containing protein [Deltaproteobacteria bacterium]